MVPLSPEAQSLLDSHNLTYDEVIFYESYHQIGNYVRRYRDSVKRKLTGTHQTIYVKIVPSYRHHGDAVGSYHDIVRFL